VRYDIPCKREGDREADEPVDERDKEAPSNIVDKRMRAVRINGRDLQTIAFGSDKAWKSTCKRIRGIVHAPRR
jgi:hypothetical protein